MTRPSASWPIGSACSCSDGQVILDDEDVTTAIRSTEVTAASRFVADSPSVRRRLAEWQRAFAAVADTVTEGRDQGTIVFPGAFRKFFLIAGEEERARRRLAELLARGEPSSFEQVLAAQRIRDRRDARTQHRSHETRGRRRHGQHQRHDHRGGGGGTGQPGHGRDRMIWVQFALLQAFSCCSR